MKNKIKYLENEELKICLMVNFLIGKKLSGKLSVAIS